MNLTRYPNNDNLPDGGPTFEQFKSMMQTGHLMPTRRTTSSKSCPGLFTATCSTRIS
jgi:hypothetical protein